MHAAETVAQGAAEHLDHSLFPLGQVSIMAGLMCSSPKIKVLFGTKREVKVS